MMRLLDRVVRPAPATGVRGTRAATAAVLICAGCAPLFGQASAPTEPATTPYSSAVLQPGDLVRLLIWREPDLSGDFTVNQEGVVVFPKIGAHRVTDRSPEELRWQLVEAYRVYLRNPSIDVVLLRRINVRGAVREPGLYPVDATMTISDAIALAGGSTPQGDLDKVELIRGGERITTRLSRDARIADLPIQSGDQLFIPERSWISRNTGIMATAISASVSLFIALFTR